MKYSKREDIVLRQVGEFFFLVDPKISYNDNAEDILQTNEIGACIWNCIEPGDSVYEISQKVLSFINDEKTEELVSIVTADTDEFLSTLVKQGLVMEVV